MTEFAERSRQRRIQAPFRESRKSSSVERSGNKNAVPNVQPALVWLDIPSRKS